MKGRRCSIVFINKVLNRLNDLEERFGNPQSKEYIANSQTRAEEINNELKDTFCVGRTEVKQWKRIVKTATRCTNICTLPPSHYLEIAKLPEEKQQEVVEEATENNLTYKQTALLVQKTLGKVDFNPQIYNVWNFNGCDDRFGLENYPGRVPGQIVQNILYYFTQEGDLVVDPMAGSGTTFDVCQMMNRRCLSYDLNPKRDEIHQHDVNGGFPQEAKDCNLIFLDPPYFNMVYKNFYTDVQQFYSFMNTLAQNCYDTLCKNGYVSILMADMTELGNYCLSGECYSIFKQNGFQYECHISVPMTTENFLPQQVIKAKTEKRMLGRNRDLYVFRKP